MSRTAVPLHKFIPALTLLIQGQTFSHVSLHAKVSVSNARHRLAESISCLVVIASCSGLRLPDFAGAVPTLSEVRKDKSGWLALLPYFKLLELEIECRSIQFPFHTREELVSRVYTQRNFLKTVEIIREAEARTKIVPSWDAFRSQFGVTPIERVIELESALAEARAEIQVANELLGLSEVEKHQLQTQLAATSAEVMTLNARLSAANGQPVLTKPSAKLEFAVCALHIGADFKKRLDKAFTVHWINEGDSIAQIQKKVAGRILFAVTGNFNAFMADTMRKHSSKLIEFKGNSSAVVREIENFFNLTVE